MNLFIDTNIFLDFYRLSGGDLEELRKIAKLSENDKIDLLISDYLKDEFYRNRESTISHAISQFRKSKIELHLPNIVRVYDESNLLRKTKDEFEKLIKSLNSVLLEDIKESNLKADSVILEVFSSAQLRIIPEDVLQLGVVRSQLGKPPGKKDSCGDAIHWEWLLSEAPQSRDLIIISGDGDFESELIEGNLSSYLYKEWQTKKETEVHLYKSLNDFLKDKFPDIELADEIDKEFALEKLERSSNFTTTHNALEKLNAFDDFSPEETMRMISAFISNDQIHWILGDDDVKHFAIKLVYLAYDIDRIDEVYPLEEMLNELELKES